MLIKRIEIFHIAIPFLQSFETSFGVIDERPAVIIKMTDDKGMSGFGECSTLYVPMSESEIISDSMRVLSELSKKIINVDIQSSQDLKLICDSIPGFPVSKLALEGAYVNLLAVRAEQPLYAIFESKQNQVKVGESVGIKTSIEDVIEEVGKRIQEGYTRVKLKIKPGYDYEVVKAVREKFPNLSLGVDANSGYGRDLIDNLIKLDEFNLIFIEQPFDGKDLELHAELQKQLNTPVCLDESIVSLESCRSAIEMGACKMVNIKPARIGSFIESKLIHDYCLEKNIPLFGGGRFETGIGKVTNAHFFTLPGFSEAADLTPPTEYFQSDLLDPDMVIQDGVFVLPALPGLGFNVNESMMHKYQKEHLVFD